MVTQYANILTAHRTLRHYAPRVSLSIEKGRYEVKTASNWSELEEVLRLRYDVFHREFMNKKFPIGVDMDNFDAAADHLIIVEKATGKIVGTYRFLCSLFTHSFYSETEFDLRRFLSEPGIKLELSRACIHRDFRSGQVMHLLWRGLMKYVQEVNARFLFGCGSVKTTDSDTSALLYRHLETNGALDDKYRITPLPTYTMDTFDQSLGRVASAAALPDTTMKELMPPLLAAYLKAGAKVCSRPALDRAFRCIDFLTILNMEDISEAHARRYAGEA